MLAPHLDPAFEIRIGCKMQQADHFIPASENGNNRVYFRSCIEIAVGDAYITGVTTYPYIRSSDIFEYAIGNDGMILNLRLLRRLEHNRLSPKACVRNRMIHGMGRSSFSE